MIYQTRDEMLAALGGTVGGELVVGDPGGAQAGVHQLSVNGKRKDIADEDLLAVADRFGIGTAPTILRQAKEVFQDELKECMRDWHSDRWQ